MDKAGSTEQKKEKIIRPKPSEKPTGSDEDEKRPTSTRNPPS
jgi:hypothetical protein